MSKTGGAVKRLTEKAKQHNMRRTHGGFARFAEHDGNMFDRRAGAARLVEPRSDRTIPAYDHAMVKRLEPGKVRAFYFGQEPRREVTCYGNGERRWSRGGLLNCWHMSEHATELLGPDRQPKR